MARSSKILSGADVPARREETSLRHRPEPQNGLIYDLDWNAEERLAEWHAVLAETRGQPVVLRAAVLLEAWSDIEVLQHATWLGPLLVASLLRQEGLAAHHLACIHLGAKSIPRERRRARNRGDRLADAFAKLLGTSRVTVNARRQSGQVLGIDGAKRGFRFPVWQLDKDGRPFEALPALHAMLGNSAWAVYRFLVSRHGALDGRTGLQALQQGDDAAVLAAAEGMARGDFD
ncbi:DUF1612 domain-containing protein [Mesorhizobium sp. M0522]|uniref:DUF1612 domain-containing protein n=1 Tax=Mesorhizobium sp. M0522 TaxID=2956958 RepID=UPI003337FEBA